MPHIHVLWHPAVYVFRYTCYLHVLSHPLGVNKPLPRLLPWEDNKVEQKTEGWQNKLQTISGQTGDLLTSFLAVTSSKERLQWNLLLLWDWGKWWCMSTSTYQVTMSNVFLIISFTLETLPSSTPFNPMEKEASYVLLSYLYEKWISYYNWKLWIHYQLYST